MINFFFSQRALPLSCALSQMEFVSQQIGAVSFPDPHACRGIWYSDKREFRKHGENWVVYTWMMMMWKESVIANDFQISEFSFRDEPGPCVQMHLGCFHWNNTFNCIVSCQWVTYMNWLLNLIARLAMSSGRMCFRMGWHIGSW